MKKTLFLAFSLIILMCRQPMSAQGTGIMPRPAEMHLGKGQFTVTAQTPMTVDAAPDDCERLLAYARENLPGYMGATAGRKGLPAISLSLGNGAGPNDSPEGYELTVAPKGVSIKAGGPAGLFYGLQTLIQLADGSCEIPAVEIKDYPRLEYRGLMLDISRHFRDKEFIKKQIDAIAKLKINRLHLHLTDAAGWRIEIKRYPELTAYAAWRPQETWKEWCDGGSRYISGDDPLAHGGFLTQDDAREIVEYAADRYITVIPEIEMPSHSEEVTATYPHLACAPGPQPDVCIGNEETLEFFKNVLDEIIDIFPSQYIHVGGDEASKQAWKNCEKCLALMKKENLGNVEELQSYLIAKIEQYLNSKGRELIGWDEIMEGNPTPSSTIMTWRGIETGIEAAKSGHKVIMTPGAYCYIDSYQDAPPTQPEAISGYTPLSKVYGYNPVPDSLKNEVGDYISGIQGNLWCEYVPTAQHAEYMLYPRMIAIAEIGWTPQELRNWDDFYQRALEVNDRLQREGYHVFDLRGEVGNRREALLGTEHIAKGKKVTYNVPWWSKYNAAFEKSLTDGERGGWSYGDGKWQGFMSDDEQRLDAVIDLEKPTDIRYIGAEFMQIIGPEVWLPEHIVISVSDDGVNFRELADIHHEQRPTAGLSFKTFDWEGNTRARYVRYVATAPKGCLFTDEIVVK